MSNTLSKSDMAKRIVYTQEVGLTSEEEGKSLVDDYLKLPAYAWVTMCDGALVQKWIDYKFDKGEEKKLGASMKKMICQTSRQQK